MSFIDDITEKVASYFEEKTPEGLPPESPSISSLKQLAEIYPAASLFDYESYDASTKLYHNKNSIGVVLELSPFVGFSESSFETLHSYIIEELPDTAIVQCTLWASPKIFHALEIWARTLSKRGGVYEKIALRRAKHLEKSAFESLLEHKNQYLRDVRILVSISMPDSNDIQANTLVKKANSFKGTMTAMGGFAQFLAPDALISLLTDWINPTLTVRPSKQKWDKRKSINHQIVSPENNIQVQKSQIALHDGQWLARSFTVTELPREWQQFEMTNLIGDEDREFLQAAGQFFINVIFKKMPKDKAKRKAATKFATSERNASSSAAKLMPLLKYINEDWRMTNESLSAGKATLVNTYIQVLSLSHQDNADVAEENLKTLFQSAGWTLKRDKYISLIAWLSLFPMQTDAQRFNDLIALSRTRTLLSHNIVNFLPLQGEWKGGGKPCMLLAGRRGQVSWWDPFANQEGNYNVAVTGKSRSGKSVLLQELALSVAGAGGRAFIFDIGRSFEKLCKYVGGEFIEFDKHSTLSINPFTGVQDIDRALEMLNLIFSTMVSDERNLTEIESAYLEQAIKETWLSYGEQADVTKVANWLEQHQDSRASDVGVMLFKYTEAGSYGRYFKGACTLNFDNPYIVLELDELKTMKKLQSVVLMILMYHITEVMYHGDRKSRTICIIDEAWDLLDSKLGAKFIETGYRRAAKYNGAFVSGTQGIADYDKNDSSRACAENSDTTLILMQTDETIERAEKSGLLDMSPHLKKTLKCLKTIQEEYAEICIKSPQGYSINRLLLDGFSTTLYSSKGPVFAAVKQLIDEGIPMQEAIEAVSLRVEKGEFKS